MPDCVSGNGCEEPDVNSHLLRCAWFSTWGERVVVGELCREAAKLGELCRAFLSFNEVLDVVVPIVVRVCWLEQHLEEAACFFLKISKHLCCNAKRACPFLAKQGERLVVRRGRIEFVDRARLFGREW